MNKPKLGISIMPDLDFLNASLPLFQNENIEVIEWSFDTIRFKKNEPKWLNKLLLEYSNANCLIGHGVHYSLFDAKWSKRQTGWLKNLKEELKRYKYSHISEHFGFMSNGDYHKGCPFPIPLNKRTLALGIDRLKRLQDAAQLPVGIENLAFAFAKNDVREQGEFIHRLLEPINGFIVLDLHNIYCQSENFGIEMMDLIALYPLDSVKEIHISGGSWQKSIYQGKIKKIRRDTHDGNIPKIIFSVLPLVLAKCKYTEFIIFERMGNTFNNPNDFIKYQNDFVQLKNIINTTELQFKTKEWGRQVVIKEKPLNDLLLYKEQKILCQALLESNNYRELLQKLDLKNWNVSSWNPEMIDTAIKLGKKWN